jgi:hypothetical protein
MKLAKMREMVADGFQLWEPLLSSSIFTTRRARGALDYLKVPSIVRCLHVSKLWKYIYGKV